MDLRLLLSCVQDPQILWFNTSLDLQPFHWSVVKMYLGRTSQMLWISDWSFDIGLKCEGCTSRVKIYMRLMLKTFCFVFTLYQTLLTIPAFLIHKVKIHIYLDEKMQISVTSLCLMIPHPHPASEADNF